MVGMTPIRSSPCKRLALRAGHVGQLFGFAQDAQCLFRDLQTEGRETDDAPGPFDQHYAEQVLQLAQSRRQGRLSDETGLGRLAEVTMLAKRDEVLKLLDRGQVDNHR